MPYADPADPTYLAPHAPRRRVAAASPVSYSVNDPIEAPAPVLNPQRVRMEQNMGLRPRGPSNPQFAMAKAYQTLNAAQAPVAPGVQSPAAPASPAMQPTATPAPVTPTAMSPAPAMASNPVPATQPAAQTPAPVAPKAAQPQRMNASNGISDQEARQIYKVAMSQNPGDLAAGEQQFHETMAKYEVNGKALLDHWHGGKAGPQTDFVTGYSTSPAQPRVDMNLAQGQQLMGAPITPGSGGQALLVTRPNGQTVMVNEHGGVVGPPIAQGSPLPDVRTPIIGPKPGYTPLPAGSNIGPTKNLDNGDVALGKIRDDYQAPFGSNARDISPAPVAARPPSPEQVASAQAMLAFTPPTEREVFNAASDIGMAQAQLPLEKIDLQNQGKVQQAQATGEVKKDITQQTNETRKDIATGHDTSREKMNTDKIGSNEKITDKKIAGAKEIQELKNVGAADVARLRQAIGGKPGEPMTNQQRTFVTAFGRTAQFDENFAPRKFEDRLAEAKQIMAAGAQGNPAATQPTAQPTAQTAGQTTQANPQARAQQTGNLKPVPKSTAMKFISDNGGDLKKAKEAAKAAGFDPDNVIEG